MVKLLESLLIIGISINLLSAVLTRYRYSGKRQCEPAGFSTPIRITVLRPICGLEPFLEQNIRSTFMQRNEPQWLCDLDIYFCIDDPNDPALPIVHQVYDEFPDQLKLLIGNPWKQFSIDPKLNNLQKGFTKLTTEMIKNPRRAHFVCVVDSNIRLPPGYLLEMLGKKTTNIGLVCSPPFGTKPQGFGGWLEAAFLNTYQARVQLAVDTIGEGYAQGKAMLWNYSDMTSEDMLGELSEDVAATKYLNSKNLGVALTELPFEQPIGHKTFKEAMDRQIRWAIIRRHSFPVEYALEIISTGLFWVILASLINWPMALVTAMLWYGIEAWLATRANWPLSWWWSPITWVARDLLIPIMWLIGWFKSNFNWRGNRRFV